MLSALAKYIFGGMMNDAPETTTMQYETREINDWLLVDMPDQDIDNEDMDSETEEDDILTAVPLLLAEEGPRQIVISYEADSPCDKSCAKIRKGFQDKIHSASSKVQAHTGDKIQGNFVANVEAISVETDKFSNGNAEHNLSGIQGNVKSKQSKSKISKPKNKKNKINKKCSAKMQDQSLVSKKKHNDNVQEKPNDNMLLNLKEENQYVSKESPEKLKIKRDTEKVEDGVHTAIIDNSNYTNAEKVEEDLQFSIIDNFSHINADKVEDDMQFSIINNSSHTSADTVKEDLQFSIIDNSSHISAGKAEVGPPTAIIENSSHSNQCVCDNFLENYISSVQENVTDKMAKNADKKTQYNFITVERNLGNISKRSYADVVKAKPDVLDKDNNKENSVDKICKNELESPEAQDIQTELENKNAKPKCKKSKPKKISENKIDMKSQNISVSISCQDTGKVQEDFNHKSKSIIAQVRQNSEIIQDSFGDRDEAVLINFSENFESGLQDMSKAQGIEDIFDKNLCSNHDFQDEVIQEDFIDDIYFGSSHNSNNGDKVIFVDNHQILSSGVNDIHQEKIKNSFEFQQNMDDTVLENIADLWDIYTKIQDNSDDEVHEISDDEMNENFNQDIKEASDKEMKENSDEQITDDEMNSLDDYEEISDDEVHKRSCGRIFPNLFREENSKLYNRVFEYSQDVESEESDSEMFTSIQDHLILPSIKRMTSRKPELLQPFKCDFLEELKPNATEIPKNHSSCVPFSEYELVEYFNFEPQYFYACQSLQYPSSYALAIAEYYANQDQYFPKYSERCNAFIQKYKRRATVENQTPPASNESSLITNSADILQKIINQKCSTLPTKTAVVLEHVKDLKPIQEAIQYEARKYLTRSQLNRQNRNYIYQSSVKTNRRRNLQRNHSGVNNNRKCY